MGCQGGKTAVDEAGTVPLKNATSPDTVNRSSSGTLLPDTLNGTDVSTSKVVGTDGKKKSVETVEVKADTQVDKPSPPPALQELVVTLRSSGTITKDSVERAMLAIDRRHYAPRTPYVDTPQPIGFGATISAPHMHAHALELLSDFLKPGAHALDVGVGSGYLSACMAQMVGSTGKVVGIDHLWQLVEMAQTNIRKTDGALLDEGHLVVQQGDGWRGVPELGPYDCIHVGAAAESVPIPLLEQLKVGGRMVIPVGKQSQYFYLIDRRQDGSYTETQLMGVRYVPLVNPAQIAGIPPQAFEQAELTKAVERVQNAPIATVCEPIAPKAPPMTASQVEKLQGEPIQFVWVPPGDTQFAPKANGKDAGELNASGQDNLLFSLATADATYIQEAPEKQKADQIIPDLDLKGSLVQVKGGKKVEPSDAGCCERWCCPKQERRERNCC